MKKNFLFIIGLFISMSLSAQTAVQTTEETTADETVETSIATEEPAETLEVPALSSDEISTLAETDVPFEITDPRLAKNYKIGCKLDKIGKILTLVGAPVMVASTIVVFTDIGHDDFDGYDRHLNNLGVACVFGVAVGALMVDAGIPLWITGSIMKKNTMKAAVKSKETGYQPNYRLGVTASGGIGLAVNF